jgi:hypothetical protein
MKAFWRGGLLPAPGQLFAPLRSIITGMPQRVRDPVTF